MIASGLGNGIHREKIDRKPGKVSELADEANES